MDNESTAGWIRFANLQLPPRTAAALLQAFAGDPAALFDASDSVLEDIPVLQAAQMERLRDTTLIATPQQLDWLNRRSVRLLTIGQPGYPRLLQTIPDPPAVLFVRGALSESNGTAVGIVGSRDATPYGRATADKLARELCSLGITVISGGAIGIDAAAHAGAVDAGGSTVAVLGCGIDVDYPRENRALFEQILVRGAVVTEYPPGAQPDAWRFPQRNRVISGVSQGVIVVEAPHQSGALITARYALEQGRTVMTVPGNIDRPSSRGSNDLLKDGAVPVTETADVLHALNLVALSTLDTAQTAPLFDDVGRPGASRADRASDLSLHKLPGGQQKLMRCLSLSPQHIDAIAHAAGIAPADAGAQMTLLELSGLVRRLPGNTYIRGM